MTVCYEWTVEVDQDRQRCNYGAQERFIVQFIGSLYEEIEAQHPQLSTVQSLRFTRIFMPMRDEKGAYVRLRLFVEEEDLALVKEAMDDRLAIASDDGLVFQIARQRLDWERVAENHGGRELAATFRDYLASISRTSYELLSRKQEGLNVENIIWPWTHFFFNSVRGYGRSVVEFVEGAVTGFIGNA
jgi:hypothetical protein